VSWCRVCGGYHLFGPELQGSPYPGRNEKVIAAAKPSPPVHPEISLDSSVRLQKRGQP
jgi:hypothetical protein